MEKNNCIEDRIEMAKEIAEIRRTGLTNMMARTNVIEVLESLGYDFTADYIKEVKSDFMDLLVLSGKY